jgi:hypothetical protein
MTSLRVQSTIAAVWLSACVFLSMTPQAAAQSTCAQQGTVSINSNQYIYQQDEWNSTATQCATVSGVGFSLTTANFNLPNGGPPATYPSIFMGCHWGNCTNASQSHMPIQESNIASASTSVNTTLASGNYDVAYDIWFNQTSTTSGQPNGTEVMIWINHSGFPQPFGSQVATVTIDGASWAVWTGRQSSWNIVSYVRNPGVTSVSNLNLLPFFSDAVSRGSLQSSWWLIDVEMGFEIWTGGQGLGISGFSVNATAGGGGGSTTPTITSITPASGTDGSRVTIAGSNFGATQGSSTVNFGLSHAAVTSWSNTSITATVPNLSAGAVSVSVTVGGVSSNSVGYTVTSSGGGGGASACHINYAITNTYPGGFQAAITINNTGSAALSNWTLKWIFSGNQQITNLWNGSLAQSGEAETVNSLSYNGSIPAGGSYSGLGFTATVTGTNAVPTSFTLNGTQCN